MIPYRLPLILSHAMHNSTAIRNENAISSSPIYLIPFSAWSSAYVSRTLTTCRL